MTLEKQVKVGPPYLCAYWPTDGVPGAGVGAGGGGG